MRVSVYVVRKQGEDGTETYGLEATFGPYGYTNEIEAYRAARDYAEIINGYVLDVSLEFTDSELVDDFTANGKGG